MQISLFSFGFKHGPPDADTVWDVRFLPNPFYVAELKELTGRQRDVAAFVLNNSLAEDFFINFEPMLLSYINSHAGSGRENIRIAIGCTGGKHRSVAVTEHVHSYLKCRSLDVEKYHRDIDRE